MRERGSDKLLKENREYYQEEMRAARLHFLPKCNVGGVPLGLTITAGSIRMNRLYEIGSCRDRSANCLVSATVADQCRKIIRRMLGIISWHTIWQRPGESPDTGALCNRD
jgi:hypothetical protein